MLRTPRKRPLFACLALAFGLCASARAQLTFNLVYAPGINAQALAGFQEAAARWSAVFSDPITIKLNIAYNTSSGAGVLGSTNANFFTLGYTGFKTAMASDRTSANDYTAVASLQSGTSYSLLLNHPNSGTNTDRYTGAGDTLLLTVANARALGLYQSSGGFTDASITFNSSFSFDFNPSNGIDSGKYDFVGVATHEIGHALGFFSGVDELDANPALPESDTIQTPLDFFRYSALSGGIMDGTADTRPKFFSLDGGATSLGLFSTGPTYGDGRQASHWKDNLGEGIMDPTAAPGELLQITSLDLMAFDVIGYNLTSVPEPAAAALCLAIAAAVCVLRKRRREILGQNLSS